MKKILILTALFALATPALAEEHTGVLDTSVPVPQLSSLDKLGKLTFTMPTVHNFKTTNGINVLFTPLHQLPIVDVSVSFNAGASRDEEIKKGGFGIAKLTADMLTQGTTSDNEEQFIIKKEQLGIALSAGITKDNLTVSLRSLSTPKTLTPAVALMSDTIAKPAFDKEVLERTKTQTISSIKRQKTQGNFLAELAFNQAVFGSHPYANPTNGSEKSIATISQDDLKAFKNQYLVANNAKITITGDLSLAQAKALAEQLAKPLPNGTKAKDLPAPPTPKPQHIHINHTGTQVSVIMGHLSDKINTDPTKSQARTDLSVANEIVAGFSFSARLMDDIREKKGYTYGIGGYFSPMRYAGSYRVRFSAKNEIAGNAIIDSIAVLNNAQKGGITADELATTINGNKNAFPASFASNANIHLTMTSLNNNNQPLTQLANTLNRLDKVTLDNANAIYRQKLHPNAFVIVTVGSVKPDLTSLFKK